MFVKNADVLVTVSKGREKIVKTGFDNLIDASSCVVTPGLINCHHHLFQSMARGVATGTGNKQSVRLAPVPVWTRKATAPCGYCGLSVPNLIDNEELPRNMTVLSSWIDQDLCVNCRLCAQICPVPGCITIEQMVSA